MTTAFDGSHARHLAVRKAYKMYIGGAFVRSESGRYFQVPETFQPEAKSDGDADGSQPMENIPLGSRKDTRDAVKAALGAYGGWSNRTAFNRGQILYRLSEMMDARSAELTASLVRQGAKAEAAKREVEASVDRVLAYAGWADKFHSLLSSYNPVGGPHFDFTVPESMGVVAIAAPDRPALLGLVGSIAPVVVSGNTCVVVAGEEDPRTAIVLCEMLATSDLPGGVVNLLTGKRAEMLPHLARHMEVRALDLHGVEPELQRGCEESAADSVKRVRARRLGEADWHDGPACETPRWIERFVEMKTVWHPSGV